MLKTIRLIKEDFKIIFDRDPASRSKLENFLCCQGFHSVIFYRVSHCLWNHHLKLLARLISNFARWITGVEIHPGAKIGRRFFIDHGMGVVIGETAEIGNDVSIYQGVTLGGTTWTKGKRHPTLEDSVVVGAGAILLGPITIGHDSRIGSSSVVIHNVPPLSTVVGIPGKVVHRREKIAGDGEHRYDLSHGTLPDPFSDAIDGLRRSIREIHTRLMELEENKKQI